MKKILLTAVFALAPLSLHGCNQHTWRSENKQSVCYLDDLDVNQVSQGWETAQRNKSSDGKAISINGKQYERGIGTQTYSNFCIDLHGTCREFSAMVGSPKKIGQGGAMVFKVMGDEKQLWQSPVLKGGDNAIPVNINVTGITLLELIVTDVNNSDYHDYANWALGQITYTGTAPNAVRFKSDPYILTPKEPAAPHINGAKVFGVKPDRPFLYTIAATGERPMRFEAEDLPGGLILDPNTGIVSGSIKQAGQYTAKLAASNKYGQDKRLLRIVCGNTICLSPPLGWNSWNCWGCAVDESSIRKAADAMVSTGLINHGWTYINIDDCWHGDRDKNGKVQSNKRFPDMKALADYVHSKGLKIGIYTDCGAKTCAGYVGSQGHELDDIMTYADWGFDYVKIDWCYCENKKAAETYRVFGDAIGQAWRDIVFSICNWGVDKPWTWGAEVGGNCWRTTGDITDSWASVYSIGFNCSSPLSTYPKPGHWNDPDMLVVGRVGWGPTLRPSRLTADEQYSHISLWAMLAAPMLIGCDLTQPDDFTLNLLTNDEVIAIDQDPLGKPAICIAQNGLTQVWVRELEDGSKAVGLFNLGQTQHTVTLKWSDAGLTGKQMVRNIWKNQDIGEYGDKFESTIPRHGVMLIKLIPAK